MGGDRREGDAGMTPDPSREAREREFSRRQLLRAGWAVPVVLSLGLAACDDGGDDGGQSQHTDRPHSDAGHADAPHIDQPAGPGTTHADVPHADSNDGRGPTHTDTPPHADVPPHDDIPPHDDAAPHADTPHSDARHSDARHFDAPHADEPVAAVVPPFGDGGHGDSFSFTHQDSAHGDLPARRGFPHADSPHIDDTHGDAHSDL